MALFEDAVIMAKDAVDAAGKFTSEMVELSRLKVVAAKYSGEISKRYEALGKAVYDAAKTGSSADDLIRESVTDIDDLYGKLAEVNDRICELKNIVQCPNCKAVNPSDSVYCSKCGTKLVSQKAEEPKAEQPQDAGEDSSFDAGL